MYGAARYLSDWTVDLSRVENGEPAQCYATRVCRVMNRGHHITRSGGGGNAHHHTLLRVQIRPHHVRGRLATHPLHTFHDLILNICCWAQLKPSLTHPI